MKQKPEIIDTGLISKVKAAAKLCSGCTHYAMILQPSAISSFNLTPKEKWKMRSHTLRWERRYKKAYEIADGIEGSILGVRVTR